MVGLVSIWGRGGIGIGAGVGVEEVERRREGMRGVEGGIVCG